MLEAIKTSSYKVKMNLRSVYVVTQWKDGCVYRTKQLGLIVCLRDYSLLSKQAIIGSCPTKITRELYK